MKTSRDGTASQRGPLPSLARRRSSFTPAQTAIFDHLVNQPEPCAVSALAAQVCLHPNTVREHLDALVAVGAVHRSPAPTSGRGRPAWLYAATDEAQISDDAQEYASLAAVLAGHIARTSTHPAADAEAAGLEWGHNLVCAVATTTTPAPDSTDRHRIVALFDHLGFAPEADADVTAIRLRRCPLLATARQYPEVVCGVHLGIVRGALAEIGATAPELRLHPFAEPGACVLHFAAPAPATR